MGHTQSRAFTLVELSIVLVILGLLTGGILTGQSLIHAAELRSVTTQFNQYQAATQTFRDKYHALPGDMKNATKFWGVAHVTPATCRTTSSVGTETCDGNGNGTFNDDEMYRIWQHLSNAGLIEGHYTGTSNTGPAWGGITIDTNIPASRISNAGFLMRNHSAGDNSAEWIVPGTDAMNPVIQFGRSTGVNVEAPALSPEGAWNIDIKMDDGRPGMGIINGFKKTGTNNPGCLTADAADAAEWDVSKRDILCAMAFYMK